MLIDITKVDVLKRLDVLKTRRRIADALPKTATAEQLVEIAKILGVQVALVSNRPHFGARQVRSICQLRVGMTYLQVHVGTEETNTYKETLTVIEEPFFTPTAASGPGWWVKVRDERGRVDTMSLQDKSVNVYGVGRWNESNYLAFTDQSYHINHQPHCCCSCKYACCQPDGHKIVPNGTCCTN